MNQQQSQNQYDASLNYVARALDERVQLIARDQPTVAEAVNEANRKHITVLAMAVKRAKEPLASEVAQQEPQVAPPDELQGRRKPGRPRKAAEPVERSEPVNGGPEPAADATLAEITDG